MPAELRRILGLLLAKDAAERYADCGELLEDLAILSAAPPAAPVVVATVAPKRSGKPRGSSFQELLHEELRPTVQLGAPPVPTARPTPAPDPKPSSSTPLPPSPDDGFDAHLKQGLEAALSRDYGKAAGAFERGARDSVRTTPGCVSTSTRCASACGRRRIHIRRRASPADEVYGSTARPR